MKYYIKSSIDNSEVERICKKYLKDAYFKIAYELYDYSDLTNDDTSGTHLINEIRYLADYSAESNDLIKEIERIYNYYVN